MMHIVMIDQNPATSAALLAPEHKYAMVIACIESALSIKRGFALCASQEVAEILTVNAKLWGDNLAALFMYAEYMIESLETSDSLEQSMSDLMDKIAEERAHALRKSPLPEGAPAYPGWINIKKYINFGRFYLSCLEGGEYYERYPWHAQLMADGYAGKL